jgi:hypothetical protein
MIGLEEWEENVTKQQLSSLSKWVSNLSSDAYSS